MVPRIVRVLVEMRPRHITLGLIVWLFNCSTALAGPPYVTDDPEPVEYRHWEFYVASQFENSRDSLVGTAPHIELNYGVVQNVQLHLIAPLSYSRARGGPTHYGPGDVELGVKFRFIQEYDWRPMVGTFPMFELPTGSEAKGLGSGRLHVFVPLWVQKSVGRFTTYGGGGYWINPGLGNRDYLYFGWQLQRRFSQWATLGGEVFYTTPDAVGARANLRFNVGLVLDFSDEHHLLFSTGRSIVGDTLLEGYLAYQLTL